MCPYELPIVVLARFFALFPQASERSRILLRRWFWRGTLAGRLTGATARGKTHLCALLAQSPRDLSTGERLDPSSLFQSDPLQRILPNSSPASAALANKLLHPPTRSAKRAILACEDEGALMSHAIDRAARDALHADDGERFIDARSAILDRWIRAFLASHAESERDDAPPLHALTRRSA